MKLHLPTALFALAVLPAVAFAEEKTLVVGTDDQGNTLIKLPEADLKEEEGEVSGYHTLFAHEDNFEYYTPTEVKNGKATLVLDGDDKVGYFINETLQVPQGDDPWPPTATEILYVHGNVELSGNAHVQVNGKKSAYYRSGMVADAVVVSENAKMNLGSAKFESLEIGGSAHVIMENGCDNGAGVGGFWEDYIFDGSAPGINESNRHLGQVARSMTITGGLTVKESGSLVVGKTATSSHVGRYYDSNDSYFQSVIDGPILQTGGEIKLIANNYIKSDSITQEGGTMTLSHDNANPAKLRFEDAKVSINQSGGTMNIEGVIIRGDSGKEELQLVINQSGSGTINMSAGSMFTGKDGNVVNHKVNGSKAGSMFTTADDGPASVIKQSGSGTININSNYSSATFNVEQTGKGGNITIGDEGKLQSDALTLTDASTFKIQGELALNKGAEVTFAVSSLVSTTGGLVVDGGTLNVGEFVSVKVVFSDDVVMAALTELPSADGQILARDEVLIATGVGEALTLFTGGTYEKEYDLGNGTTATVEFAYNFTEDESKTQVFANVTATVTGIGTTPAVPEPATATLSLLALAGLCARRRRK